MIKKHNFYPVIIIVVISTLVVLGSLTSCDGLLSGELTIQKRIDMFESDLNKEDRSLLYLHFHPLETASYNQIKDPAYFASSPLSAANRTFAIHTGTDLIDQGDGRFQVNGTLNHATASFTVQFIMLKYNTDWYIEELILLYANQTEALAVRKTGL